MCPSVVSIFGTKKFFSKGVCLKGQGSGRQKNPYCVARSPKPVMLYRALQRAYSGNSSQFGIYGRMAAIVPVQRQLELEETSFSREPSLKSEIQPSHCSSIAEAGTSLRAAFTALRRAFFCDLSVVIAAMVSEKVVGGSNDYS